MYIVFWKTWSHSVVWLQTFHFFYRGTLDSMTDDVITNFKLVMTIWLSNVLKEMRGGGWQRRWNFRVKSSSKILFLPFSKRDWRIKFFKHLLQDYVFLPPYCRWVIKNSRFFVTSNFTRIKRSQYSFERDSENLSFIRAFCFRQKN